MSGDSKRPDVSFVIAAFNAEDTIGLAIQSALAQTDVAVEVVVVDDCSTDATCAVAEVFADDRVRIVRLQDNCGPGKARNIGIGVATGDWIAALDADDSVRPGRSRTMIGRAEAADAQMVVDNLEVVSSGNGRSNQMFREQDLRTRPVMTLQDYISANILFHDTFNFGYMKPMVARDFLLRHSLGYDEALRIGEDYILMASALASGARCAVESSAGYVYHVRQASISRVLELHHVEAMLCADAAFLERFPLKGSALAAQYRRTRSLLEARDFLKLVSAIKRRAAADAVRVALANPAAIRYLRMPIAARLGRMMKRRPPLRPEAQALVEKAKT